MTHSQEETHTVTFMLLLPLAQRKPNKDSYTNVHGEGGKKERAEPAGYVECKPGEKRKTSNKMEKM